MSNWKCTFKDEFCSVWTKESRVEGIWPWSNRKTFIRYEFGKYSYTSYEHGFQWIPIPHVSSIEEAQQVVDVLLRLGE